MKKIILCLSVSVMMNPILYGQASETAKNVVEEQSSEPQSKIEQLKSWIGGLFHDKDDKSLYATPESKNENSENVQHLEKNEESVETKTLENEEGREVERATENSITTANVNDTSNKKDAETEVSKNTTNELDTKKEIFVGKPVAIVVDSQTTPFPATAVDSQTTPTSATAVDSQTSSPSTTVVDSQTMPTSATPPIHMEDIPTILPLVHKTNNTYNKVADKISGLAEDGSIEYRKYSNQITKNWNQLCVRSLKRVRPWALANLDPYLKDKVQSVFYVFGGPDISYACEFFPYANEYILVGLEPLGNFRSIERLVSSGNLQAFSTAINTYLRKGYFITSEMGKHFSRNEGSRGGLGMILLQLSRLNYDIISVESLGINSEGTIVSDGANVLSIVKIVFRKNPSEDELSTAYYIRMDLSNGNMRRLKMLANFVKNKKFITFVKSASYALQDRDFSTLRNFILYNTEAILQDDTGIAFSMLGRWNRRIFGQYSGATLKIFKNYIQEDMVRYFQSHASTPINFQLGYGFDQKRPALVLALRKNNPRVFVDIEDCQERPENKNRTAKIVKKIIYEKRILKKLKLI